MKERLLLSVIAVVIQSSVLAQTEGDTALLSTQKNWKTKTSIVLNFNQVALSNWAKGGQNSLAWNTIFDFSAYYRKNKWKWDNHIHFGYGISKQGKTPINKTDDQILLDINVCREINNNWHAVFNTNFRSQFTNGYDFPNDSVIISRFMSPAYIVSGIGINYYSPNEDLVFLATPISNKMLVVLDDYLSEQGAYGIDTLSKMKNDFGIFLSFFYTKKIIKNTTIKTLYTMFSAYDALKVWDINCDISLDFEINKYLSANIAANLIYDQDIKTPFDSNGDGNNDSISPRVQFRQTLGIGLVAKF